MVNNIESCRSKCIIIICWFTNRIQGQSGLSSLQNRRDRFLNGEARRRIGGANDEFGKTQLFNVSLTLGNQFQVDGNATTQKLKNALDTYR